MSSVALAGCVASPLASPATTAKPLPDSPARAASMVALSASRLVCSAMSVIIFTTSPILCAASDRPSTYSFVCCPFSAALAAMEDDWRSEEHTSELQSLMRISYAVFCLKKKKQYYNRYITHNNTQLFKTT